MSRPIRVIDKRNKQYFVVDDIYLNGYAKYLGPIPSMVYISLCRHCSFRDQKSFPSQEQIALEIGCKKRSVVNAISLLKKWNLIEIKRDRSENHGWGRNSYYLLDKSVWVKVPGAPNALGVDQVHHMHYKDTHINNTVVENKKNPTLQEGEFYSETKSLGSTTQTLSKPRKKFSSLKDIGNDDIVEIAEDYDVDPSFVALKLEVLRNYCSSKGKKYKNYKSALRNFVLGDLQKKAERRANDKKKATDATNI